MRAMALLLPIALLLIQLSAVDAVDRSKFRTCDQTSFCRVHRATSDQSARPYHNYRVQADSIQSSDDVVSFRLTSPDSTTPLQGQLSFVLNHHGQTPAVRMHVTEDFADANDPRTRWENPDVLQEPALNRFPLLEVDISSVSIAGVDPNEEIRLYSPRSHPDITVVLYLASFVFEVYNGVEKVMSANSNSHFYFEPRSLQKKEASADIAEVTVEADVHDGKKIVDYGEDGLAIYEDGTIQEKSVASEMDKTSATEDLVWEEKFGGHTDVKKFGPSSVGLDITFYNNRKLYGIPEHATDYLLKDTLEWNTETSAYEQTTDPYRLYNLDVFEYELDEPMALYGSIPLLVAPNGHSTVGAFHHNPSETFVDLFTSDKEDKTAFFSSESGVLDLFLLLGPTSRDFYRQYAELTGYPHLPPLFSLGYHQSRWNYKGEDDIKAVSDTFDEQLIPCDVLWLDIDHLVERMYFTWDPHAFPDPVGMQKYVDRVQRKMVTIIDPHIKNGKKDYFVHEEAAKKGMYVLDASKDTAFDGWCWPGSSSYVDFTNANARKWWASLFNFEKYVGSTPSLFTWNDMNEPSVFNGPEVSMPKHMLSLDGVEHREWHNMYGIYMQMATVLGQITRQLHKPQKEIEDADMTMDGYIASSDGLQRPFLLSRAFFSGSQRYGAVWTGDNAARWDHLSYGTKMLLSLSTAGLPFVGTDVGGFFGSPEAELQVRWHQSATFHPFFRNHAHHDSARREPYLADKLYSDILRDWIRFRYSLLPYIYTTFWENQKTGFPVLRSLWMEYQDMFQVEDQVLLGKDLLMKPIVEKDVRKTTVQLPAQDVWYSVFDSYKRLEGGQQEVDAPLEYAPVFQRGGSILPTKKRVRRTASLMHMDPLTLVVCVDKDGKAEGVLYLDDEASFDHISKEEYTVVKYAWDAGLVSNVERVGYDAENWIERVEVIGLGQAGKEIPKKAVVNGEEKEVTYDESKDVAVVRKPGMKVAAAWEMKVE